MPLPLGGRHEHGVVPTGRFQGKTVAVGLVIAPPLTSTHPPLTVQQPPDTFQHQLKWLDCLRWTQHLGHSPTLRQQTWQAATARFPALEKDIVPKKYATAFHRHHFGPKLQLGGSSPEASQWLEAITQLQDRGLTALALEAGGETLGQLVADSLSGKSLNPWALRRLLQQQPRPSETPQHHNQPHFQGGFDPFGATFAVGLATYVYGKVKNNAKAERLGKTLMLVGVIPNLLLMGTAVAAFLKVAFFSGTGLA